MNPSEPLVFAATAAIALPLMPMSAGLKPSSVFAWGALPAPIHSLPLVAMSV